MFSSVHIGDFKLKDTNSEVADSPLVAIVMPIYNTKPHYLKEAVESILKNQNYPSLKLIIIDDGSNDSRCVKAIDQLVSEDIRIILKRLNQNKGLPNALNIGIQEALSDPKVEYIARMDSDDISSVDRIQA